MNLLRSEIKLSHHLKQLGPSFIWEERCLLTFELVPGRWGNITQVYLIPLYYTHSIWCRGVTLCHVYICCLLIQYIIVIMSCHKHRYPWPSLATSPYRSSPLADLQGYIPYPHTAAECMFVLVVLLFPGHMWGSIGVHHLWARPCLSSSVLHVGFV